MTRHFSRTPFAPLSCISHLSGRPGCGPELIQRAGVTAVQPGGGRVHVTEVVEQASGQSGAVGLGGSDFSSSQNSRDDDGDFSEGEVLPKGPPVTQQAGSRKRKRADAPPPPEPSSSPVTTKLKRSTEQNLVRLLQTLWDDPSVDYNSTRLASALQKCPRKLLDRARSGRSQQSPPGNEANTGAHPDLVLQGEGDAPVFPVGIVRKTGEMTCHMSCALQLLVHALGFLQQGSEDVARDCPLVRAAQSVIEQNTNRAAHMYMASADGSGAPPSPGCDSMDVAGPLCDQLELNKVVSQDPIESLMDHLSRDMKDLLTSKFLFDREEAQEHRVNYITLRPHRPPNK